MAKALFGSSRTLRFADMTQVKLSLATGSLVAPVLLADARGRLSAVWLRALNADAAQLALAPDGQGVLDALGGCAEVFTDMDWGPAQPAGVPILSPASVALIDGPLTAPPGQQAQPWLGGAWFRHPPPGQPAAASASRAQALKLLQLVTADAETHALEEAMRGDAQLSYQMLRLVNSPGIGGGRREIGSLAQAILMLGRAQLKRWINLVLFSARGGDTRSAVLFAHVAMRARLLELLAEAAGQDKAQQEVAFMAGMFSWLDALFAKPLNEVLHPLQLPDALRRGLLQGEGPTGDLLATAKAWETCDAPALPACLDRLGISFTEGSLASLKACAWALGIARDQGSPGG